MSWDADRIALLAAWIIVLAPCAALVAAGVIAAFGAPVNERGTNRMTQASVVTALLAASGVLGLMLVTGRRSVNVEIARWVVLPEEHFHFSFSFLFDRLSIAFLILSLVLSSVVAAFARVYLHQEAGYRRFYVLFAVFVLGMVLSSVAGTIEVLFAGWELVGLSSALLVGFFQDRPAPVENGLRVWIVYRIADAAFLAGAVALHHLAGAGDFARIAGAGVWPEGTAAVTSAQAFAVGLLFVFAAAGKSALIPFCGWLPRAMEGPTPSSAIFYGALSVHLGAYLLLRVEALIEHSPALSALVVLLGLATSFYAAVAARVQADIKSVLAFASLTQVGLIVAEIGLGLRHVALAHIIGNACLRTLQLLRAPSLLHDYHELEDAIGAHLPRTGGGTIRRRLPEGWRCALYRLGYERAFFDVVIGKWLVWPFLKVLRGLDALERRWTDFLSGGASRRAERSTRPAENTDEWT